jgi:ParB family chromosome partitioning protein
MAKAAPKLVLSPSRDIPFDKLLLSQSNVRRVKAGVSIPELAEDIARRTLLQGLNVRPVLDGEGQETGMFEVPAGGRRYRALELLVKQKRLARSAPVPCVVRLADDISAEEDSLAENTHREQLHPLDQFRGMQRLADQGEGVEAIAAHFATTPAVVRQRLRLASVSPRLHEIYAEDGITLDQLMAFTVSNDHARQEQVWEMLAHSWNKQPSFIRQKLTENTVRASDRRALFIGVDAYVAAGGAVVRDLFEADDGGWLQDVALLDRLVDEKLKAEGEQIGLEGWKWVAVAVDFPYGYVDEMRELDAQEAPFTDDEQARITTLKAESDAIEAEYENARDLPDAVEKRIEAIDEELAALQERPAVYDAAQRALAGAFVSLDSDGSLYIERGFVRPEDEPTAEGDLDGEGDASGEGEAAAPGEPGAGVQRTVITVGGAPAAGPAAADDEEDEVIRPLADQLVSELTAQRTLALQDAFAQNPPTAFASVLHALVLSTFHLGSRESCLGISVSRVSFPHQAPGLKDSPSAQAITARHASWKERLPKSDRDLWDALLQFDATEQAALFAHCAAYAVNALCEVVPRYDNGRISAHTVERRILHSDVLARAVGLDMVAAGWKPTVDNYLGRVTKPRILEAVTEAKGEQTAGLIDHLKKGDMAREAERLLDDASWLPEPLRTPDIEGPATSGKAEMTGADDGEALPAFLDQEGEAGAADEEAPAPANAAAAE